MLLFCVGIVHINFYVMFRTVWLTSRRASEYLCGYNSELHFRTILILECHRVVLIKYDPIYFTMYIKS